MARTRRIINLFTRLKPTSGFLLATATCIAFLLANAKNLAPYYQALLNNPIIHHPSLEISLLDCINEGLMTLFFLLVSLEIKRELIQGELNRIRKASLPILAALGGLVLPACIFLIFNHADTQHRSGWAIPIATDIAFSLGVLSLLNHRIPSSLKIFLTALAIIDDLIAIVVIATFYSHTIYWIYLGLALLFLLTLLTLNYLKVSMLRWYLLTGLGLWLSMLHSGVHATIAGVLLGFCIPLKTDTTKSHLIYLEKKLEPWVMYGILPIFALANAGLSFIGINWKFIFNPLTLGIALGLFLGKQLGIFLTSLLAIRLKLAKLPQGSTWLQLYGVSLLCGIGFTMSLFIGTLAFGTDLNFETQVRLGVLAGSLLSGCTGYLVLRLSRS
jgi:Na+:H+ antiporter, NhaA family